MLLVEQELAKFQCKISPPAEEQYSAREVVSFDVDNLEVALSEDKEQLCSLTNLFKLAILQIFKVNVLFLTTSWTLYRQ